MMAVNLIGMMSFFLADVHDRDQSLNFHQSAKVSPHFLTIRQDT
jgi:hypothetical protein